MQDTDQTAAGFYIGERKPQPKCLLCGKVKDQHKAVTHNCPGGRKHRIHGYPWFYSAQTFTLKGKG
jgi:hypothetical protein